MPVAAPPASDAPRVSVILPTHNRAVLLKRAVVSVLGQTYRDLELIVVENACTDDTAQYLELISDPRLRRLRLEKKSGASAARNAGIRAARGPLLAFQDDDDIWLPHKLAEQVVALESAPSDTGLCLSGFVRLTPMGPENRYHRRYFEQVDFSMGVALRNFSVIATPGWLVKRALLDQTGGFDEALPARNDWELALRLSDLCRFAYVEGPLFIQDKTRPTTMARNEVAYCKALRRIVTVHGKRWSQAPKVRARHAEIIGRHEISVGNLAEGRNWLLRSLRDHPQPRVLFWVLLSWFGPKFASRFRRRPDLLP